MTDKPAVIIVNYNSYDDTLKLIKSIEDHDPGLCVIVVDNASDPGEKQKLSDIEDRCILIRLNENGGYAAGSNAGIRKAMEFGYDAFLLANSDTCLMSDHAITYCHAFMKRHGIGILGPRMVNEAGEDVSGTVSVDRYGRTKRVLTDKIKECRSLTGAFWLISRQVIEKTGYLREFYFLYREDTDYCVRAYNDGFRIVFYPRVTVMHKAGTTTKDIAAYYYYRNMFVFSREIYKTASIELAFINLFGFMRYSLGIIRRRAPYGRLKQLWRAYSDGVRDIRGRCTQPAQSERLIGEGTMDTDSRFEGTIVGGLCWNELTAERMKEPLALENSGYKVYSQNDEDGIIREIFRRIGTETKEFVELGVDNGLECNSHYLLHSGWHGLWIEGNKASCKDMAKRFRPVLKDGRLKAVNAFLTRENADGLIRRNRNYRGTEESPDFLSIDIDGNDWYVWEAIRSIRPRLVCVEYNGKFPPDYCWKQAYDQKHVWDKTDWQGASLKAMEELGSKKGYVLVGTNLSGVNAFFVREDLYSKDLFPFDGTAEKLYNPYRRDLKFAAPGHASRYCLVGQEENKGVLNYFKSPKEYRRWRNKWRIEKVSKGTVLFDTFRITAIRNRQGSEKTEKRFT